MSKITTSLSGTYGCLPLALVVSEAFRNLSRSAQGVVLLVVARQNLHGGWSYQTRHLANELGVSSHTARQAVTEANRAGILAVRDEYDRCGVVCARWYSVPCALPTARQTIRVTPKFQTPPLSEIQTVPLSEIQTVPLSEIQTVPLSEIQSYTSIPEEVIEERTPQPPAARGAMRARIIEHPDLGAVNLAAIPDPRLRARDHRKLDLLAAERAAATADADYEAQVADQLGDAPSLLAAFIADIDARLLDAGPSAVTSGIKAARERAAELLTRSLWKLDLPEARQLAADAAALLDPAGLADAWSLLNAVDAHREDRVRPWLEALLADQAGLESVIGELTMALVRQHKMTDPTVKPLRSAVFTMVERVRATKARLLVGDLSGLDVELQQLSSEAKTLRPLLLV